MNPYRNYRLQITPLSPIHIGTGQSYEPTNYVIEDAILHEFDTGSVMETFTAAERKELLTITSPNRKPDVDMLKALQRFFYQRREVLAGFAVNRIPVLPAVDALYAERVGKPAQRETGGREILNRLEIDRCAYDQISRRPVLYGSSIKGAIRTALLDRVNQGRSAHERNGLHEFQGRLLKYRQEETGRPKLELDPLRLVQVSDATAKAGKEEPMAQVQLAVNRKKQLVKDTKGQVRKAMGENLYQILECVSGWHYRAFSGQLNLQNLEGLPERGGLPRVEFRWSMQSIAEACNQFYWNALRVELAEMKARGFVDEAWEKSIEALRRQAEAKFAEGRAFLLRVGRHSGAESVTVSGARKGHIKIMKQKGEKPDYADAAKTLWLAANSKDQQKGLLPFGWMLVEVQPLDTPVNDWPELQAICEPHLQQANAFAERLARQQAKLQQAAEQARALRDQEQAKAIEKAQKDEQDHREEEERQRRLESLSDNARRAEQLREKITPASKGRRQGDQLYQLTNALIKEAAEWPAADRAVLREVAIAAFEHLGLKKDDYKKLIRGLTD